MFSKTICKTNIYSLQIELLEILNDYFCVFVKSIIYDQKNYIIRFFSDTPSIL